MENKEILDYIIKNDGATIKVPGFVGEIVTYSEGYQVGLQAGSKSVSKDQLKETLEDFVAEYFEFGVWLNPNTGKYDFDVCVWVKDLQNALELAKREKQQAIWDWKNMDGIIVKY